MIYNYDTLPGSAVNGIYEKEQNLPPQYMPFFDIGYFKLAIFKNNDSERKFDLPPNCLQKFRQRTCSRMEPLS